VRRGLDHLIAACGNLTVVTNEIFSGGAEYAGETLAYMKNLAALNRELAARADLVVEIVCGLPNLLKGELP
jgi:adenosylcobinamide kinase/adenosylcobinamide-phosphate guanylyltransferase